MVEIQGDKEFIIAQQVDCQGDKVINLDEEEETEEVSLAKDCVTLLNGNGKVDQYQDQSSPIFLNRGEFHLKLGMIVYSEDEAYDLYNKHALEKGFSIRKHQKRYKNGTKELRERSYVCSKEGIRADDKIFEIKTGQHLYTRTGCTACITFKVENGIWEIIRFNDEHNHVGGISNITFTTRDCHNYIQSRRLNLIEPGDAQMLINHFKLMQAKDPMFFYTMQLDNENRLTNIFWRDGISKLDGECFGDVVIFDTTFRTNKHNMVCAPFVGINHHWQNVLLGCAFLLDETTTSFTLVFEAFIEAMGKAPQTIFTDQDQAMANAIEKNAALKIPHLYGKSEFRKKFSKCFLGCDTEADFESTWKEMIEEWNASSNKWLNTLYSLKKKWCPAFSHDFFSANVKSTQRSESMNNVFHRVSKRTMTLTEFVEHYEENVKKQ